MSCPDSRRVSVPKNIIDDAGREALLAVVAIRDEGATAVVSLEGLGPGQVERFPYGPPFVCEETAALQHWGMFPIRGLGWSESLPLKPSS